MVSEKTVFLEGFVIRHKQRGVSVLTIPGMRLENRPRLQWFTSVNVYGFAVQSTPLFLSSLIISPLSAPCLSVSPRSRPGFWDIVSSGFVTAMFCTFLFLPSGLLRRVGKVQITFKQTQSSVELPGTFPLWKGQELQKNLPDLWVSLKPYSAWFKARRERST